MRVGSCGYVPSWQAPKATTSWGPEAGNAYPLLEASGRLWLKAQALPRVEEGGGTGRHVVKSYLPTSIVGWKSEGMDRLWDLFFLGW
jgi:hypothetical protein